MPFPIGNVHANLNKLFQTNKLVYPLRLNICLCKIKKIKKSLFF